MTPLQELSFTYPNVFLCAANLTSEKPEWQPDLIEIKTTYEDENKFDVFNVNFS